ncbi:MAG TPA: 4,5-DOPA dioxygenase extradiol [Acidimicrobiales bacterium]|nr:4,5-DOPA dioxygenase extradiol [Acidimicrobiales bacterium]
MEPPVTDLSTMPAVFVGHGSPMNTLEHNRYTDSWRAFGDCVATPRAVLSISAHWYTNATAVTAMPRPRVIHDFYGFPDELFAFDYPAPGNPEVAELVVETVKPRWVGLDVDSWGLDHGTWSVLAHMFPHADVPVVQLSINALQPLDDHLDLGARLAPLRDHGILVVGSGNLVHNLRRIDWDQPAGGFDWNRRFDEAATSLMRDNPGDVLKLVEHKDFGLAVPTPDHFIPLLYIAALAAATGDTPQVLVEGSAYGSISMTSYTLGADCPDPTSDRAAASLPARDAAPPEQANI